MQTLSRVVQGEKHGINGEGGEVWPSSGGNLISLALEMPLKKQRIYCLGFLNGSFQKHCGGNGPV